MGRLIRRGAWECIQAMALVRHARGQDSRGEQTLTRALVAVSLNRSNLDEYLTLSSSRNASEPTTGIASCLGTSNQHHGGLEPDWALCSETYASGESMPGGPCNAHGSSEMEICKIEDTLSEYDGGHGRDLHRVPSGHAYASAEPEFDVPD